MLGRLHPPKLAWSPELEWVFLRAFGPLGATVPSGSAERRRILAHSTELARRIAARTSRAALAHELGNDATEGLSVLLREQVARGLAVLETERVCCQIASENGLDCVLLKFAAMQRLGVVSVSLRGTQDLDLLVNEADLPQWTQCLEANGASRVTHWVPGYHPAVYHSQADVNVELHVRLPYLRSPSGANGVKLAELRESGLQPAMAPRAPHVFLPSTPLLVAHLIAHGLLQHGYAPAAYPALRLVSDLVDLGCDRDPALGEQAKQWLGDGLETDDLAGLSELVGHCAQGTVGAMVGTRSAGEHMLRHLLGSALDDSYRRRLRVSRLGQVLTETGLWSTVRHLGRAMLRNAGK